MPAFNFDVSAHFSAFDLVVLKRFYLGEPARDLRRLHPLVDPWDLVKRHRHLSEEGYKAVKWELLKITLVRTSPKKAEPTGNCGHKARRKCPYCLGWFEQHNWQAAHNGSNMIGFGKSGCSFCFKDKLNRYQAAKVLRLPGTLA